jgi:hypothetical protein
MVVVKRAKQETDITKCPECGSTNLLATTKGTMCKDCGHIQTNVIPVAKEQ